MDANENSEHMKANVGFLTEAEKLGHKHYQQKRRVRLFLVFFLVVAAIVVLIVGIVLIGRARATTSSCSEPRAAETCEHSIEFKNSGFLELLDKVQEAYFELLPWDIVYKPGVKNAEVKEKFEPYDFSEIRTRRITDKARLLLDELTLMKINTDMLKPREKKALAQVKHYLQHSFGSTWFRVNYYTGNWLLGPDIFCWDRICRVGDLFASYLELFKPRDVADLELLKEKLVQVRKGFEDYKKNLRYGVKAGMVRPVEACQSGLQAITNRYASIASKGPRGVFDEPYIINTLASAAFQDQLSDTVLNQWKAKYGESVNKSLHNFALEYIGEPTHQLLSFLEREYAQHCVPSNISSGMATLPLAHVYVNGTADPRRPTSGILPSGHQLNGKKAYEHILSFFSSTDLPPEGVLKIGQDAFDEYFPKILQVMKEVTNETDKATAQQKLLHRLNQSDMYFGDAIPTNESDDNAYKKCVSEESAKVYCPVRWAAMQEWFKEVYQVMSLINSKISHLFYFTGNKQTTPSCPIVLRPSFNPARGVSGYYESNKFCTKPAAIRVPFFLARPGPKYVEWSVTAHESRPGHHTEAQGMLELFGDSCSDVISWLNSATFYFAFVEGWAMYAESPLVGSDTDLYEDKPLYKYGMLTSVVWRTVRMMLDVRIHHQGLTRAEAVKEFEKYVWMPRDRADKEMSRVQSIPAQSAAYIIGQQKIVKLRNFLKQELGPKFSIKDFHYHVMLHGKAPLHYLEVAIKRYVSCIKNKDQEGCELVLNPKPQTSDGSLRQVAQHWQYHSN